MVSIKENLNLTPTAFVVSDLLLLSIEAVSIDWFWILYFEFSNMHFAIRSHKVRIVVYFIRNAHVNNRWMTVRKK